jgi:hypothetical protein
MLGIRYAVEGKYLSYFRSMQEVECIVSGLDMVKPDIIYFPWGQDFHQDHALATKVGFAVARHTASTVLQYLTPSSHSYFPNLLNVINMKEKKKLVGVFKSQMERRPKFMEIMEAQNRFFGSLIPGDGHYAEGFVLFRQVNM